MPFHVKIHTISKIIKEHYPQLASAIPKLKDELKEVKDVRNRYAHSTVDLGKEFLDPKKKNALRFINNDGKKGYYDFTKAELERELPLVNEVTDEVSIIHNYMSMQS